MIFLKIKVGALVLLSCLFVSAAQKELNEKLIVAVKSSDAQQVRSLLQQGADPKDIRRDEDTGLQLESALQLSPTAEITQLLLDAGADPNYSGGNAPPPLMDTKSIAQMIVLLKGGADPNAHFMATTVLMQVNSLDEAVLLLNAGANPLGPHDLSDPIPKGERWTGFHRNKYVRQALALSKKDVPSFCEYTADAQQIKSTRCGQKNLCMATVVCLLSVGSIPEDRRGMAILTFGVKVTNIRPVLVPKTYPIVCSALANGDCPPAEDCLLDRTFLEAEKTKTDQPASNSSSQSKPLKTGGGVR